MTAFLPIQDSASRTAGGFAGSCAADCIQPTPDVAPTDPIYGPEKDYGHFTAAQEKACKGPGE